jgi:hypothetical protein
MSIAAPERGVRLRPLRRGEYGRLVELGCFDDAAVELLEGVLVEMSPESPRHRVTDLLAEHLTRTPAESYLVRAAGPWAAGESSEPDIAVVPRGRYHQDHPAGPELADLLAC